MSFFPLLYFKFHRPGFVPIKIVFGLIRFASGSDAPTTVTSMSKAIGDSIPVNFDEYVGEVLGDRAWFEAADECEKIEAAAKEAAAANGGAGDGAWRFRFHFCCTSSSSPPLRR